MRFAPGQVSLDGHDCIHSVVHTGASEFMVDEAYVDACGLNAPALTTVAHVLGATFCDRFNEQSIRRQACKTILESGITWGCTAN